MENRHPWDMESIFDTATRELYEESGLIFDRLQWMDTAFVYQKENQTRYRVFIVMAEVFGTPRVREERIVDFQWREVDDLPTPLFGPNRAWFVPRIEQVKRWIQIYRAGSSSSD
jgi:8-oxo-dGTP pyrophosphatase MutT (NUDIX family)